MASNMYIHGPAHGYQHTHTIIFLHGRDSNAGEFASELFESEASTSIASQQNQQSRSLTALLPTIRWVFPAAPILRSQRFDADLSQWFDIWAVEDPDERSQIQHDGLNQSITSILNIIKTEEKLLPRNNIFLCGISQGFATVLSLLFAEGQGGFAGLIGLCSWIPFAGSVEEQMAGNDDLFDGKSDPETSLFSALQDIYYTNRNGSAIVRPPLPSLVKSTPVFLGHASDDAMVPIANARRMKLILSNLGLSVEWHEYEKGGHWINEPRGVDDMVCFLNRSLAKYQRVEPEGQIN